MKNQTSETIFHSDSLGERGSPSFIKIHGINQHDIETSELKGSVTNLMVSDYIKRFHERNKRDMPSSVMPPSPPRPQPYIP
ncbi:hypothetical protein R6Q59_006765 [Mikania micrantha]